jgi:PAS domain S-box-containing protein
MAKTSDLKLRTKAAIFSREGHARPGKIAKANKANQTSRQYVTILAKSTGSNQAEAAAAHLAAIINSSDDAIIGKNLDGFVTSWNAAAEKIFGYRAEEMIGQSILRLIPPDRQDEEAKILASIRRGESIRHLDTVRVRKDGRLIDVSITTSAIKNAAGQITGASKIARDISERVHTMRMLQQREAEFRTLAEAMPQIVWATGADGGNIYFNQRWMDYTGLSREESLGHGWNKPFHPEDQLRAWDAWQKAVAQAGDYSIECRIRRADGVYRWWWILGAPLRDTDGRILKWFGTCSDITERKEMEAQIQEREERFRTMANSMSQLAWIARADGFIFWYNQRWYEYTGAKPGEMEGWDWQVVHDPVKLPQVMAKWQAAINSGQPFEMEFPLRGADGTFRNFLTRGQPFRDSSGRVQQWFGTNTDVDELKQAEEKVRRLNTELEQRVDERTAQLEAANRELEAFSYSVSHDLRAPLRAVNGFADIMLEDFSAQLPEASKPYLQRIQKAGQRMGRLIDDLLDFSRLSRQPVIPQTVDMLQLVQSALEELKPQQEGRELQILTGNLPICQGDPALLKQVWINLLSNAIKYTRGRTPAVIEIGCNQENGETIYLVRDNGAGFDMQFMNKLFGVFQRLHRFEEFEGTGIGLANVQRIINRHGGRVWARAELNRGASFYFTLADAKAA